jgi:hypothetical protein
LIFIRKLKKCNFCDVEKPIDEFKWMSRDGLLRFPRCKTCEKEYRKNYYEKNKDKLTAQKKTQYQRLHEIVEEHKDKPCVDCGNRYPSYVMDFDHIDPATKIIKVSALVYSGSEPLLLDEISKCEVVCANCHRIRTHKRKEASVKK